VDLALQGGGSHGAFTWGVLDRLLECDVLRFDGVSGTSAGALNAAVLAVGWARGGAEGARAALSGFWLDVATAGACFGAASGAAPVAAGHDWERFNAVHPWQWWTQWWLRQWAPAQLNPLGLDPLRGLLERHVDARLLRGSPLRVFVTATDVHTGQPAVFSGERLSVDALLASACLPQLFRPVVIEGRAYWDGGYTGNPALWPLIYQTPTRDILLVKINPLVRHEVPDTAEEIAERVNEITFNAALVSEMRAIQFVQRLLAEQRLDSQRYKDLRLHMVADEQELGQLRPSSKLNTGRDFLLALHALGRRSAQTWMEAHLGLVGVRSSVDLEAVFLSPRAVQS
jgi:NTE family protein